MRGSARRGDRLVGLIGLFKLVKAAVLAPVGVAALVGLSEGTIRTVVRVLRWLGGLPGHHAFRAALARFVSLDDHTMRELGAACLGYAAVFLIEGVGLLRRRRWAEWLTVIVTASFIPFEVYELVQRPGAGKVVAIAVNAAIVVYLAIRRMQEHGLRISHFRPA